MIPQMITTILALALTGMAGVFLLSKCFFLAPCRLGWLMLLANVVYETLEIKLRLRRALVDYLFLLVTPAGFGFFWGGYAAGATALTMGVAWVGALLVDLRWRSDRPARQYAPLKGRAPLPIPQLIVTVRGPALERGRGCYELGDWPEGLEQEFEVLVLNPTIVRPQLPLRLHVASTTDRIAVSGATEEEAPAPEPGEVKSLKFRLKAVHCGAGGDARVDVRHGDFQFRRTLRIRAVIARSAATVQGAAIRRWKHGARAAFVWRGDQDLYDPATFQSEEGWRVALGLGRRFRMPSTLMLSARLSLVPEEHEAFCRHFGWDRKSAEIPGFARFVRDEVDKTAEQDWPTATERPFASEIGNHFYLHYGTHAAADAGNGWTSRARVGEGPYPWMSHCPADSFGEQRDNAVKGSQVLKETLGIEPASFTIPGDMFDDDTARAVEAAGLEVGSETDASKFAKVFRLPPPHHPAGCDRFVELTRMSPRDPENAFQLAMLKYWMGAARRTGRALVFLAHHHLARYEGNACRHLTEELFRHVLADHEGDVYAGTLTAVGRYWRDVLSERTRCVKVQVDGRTISIANSGKRRLTGLPLEVDLGQGRRFMRLVDVASMECKRVEV